MRVGHRVDQPRQQAAVIGENIAVVQGHGLGATGRQGEAHAVPDVATLAELPRRQIPGLQLRIQRLEPGAIIPQYPVALGQLAEERQRVSILCFIRPVEANHNLRQIGHRLQLLDNARQRFPFELGKQGRQDKPQRPGARKAQQFLLHVIHGAVR